MEETQGLLQGQRTTLLGDEDTIEKWNEQATHVGFNQGRVVWFGGPDDWQRDWLFYIENEHTLVSMW